MSLIQIPIMPESYNDIIEYSYTAAKNKKLSEHFYVKDFSTDKNDRVLISNRLVETLEILFKYLNATKCTVLSGYRTAKEEADANETFQDPHVMGAAADVIFYNGSKPIDSRSVCLALQDLGFEGGAAPIGDNYTDGKVQIEAAGKRYFNKNTSLPAIEMYSTDKNEGFHKAKNFMPELRASRPSSLLQQREAGKAQTNPVNLDLIGQIQELPTGQSTPLYGITASAEAPKRGVDISYHNGDIDWEKTIKGHYDFVIIRIGFGQDESDQHDEKLEEYIEKAESLKIPYGLYFYSYAKNLSDVEGEARHAVNLIKGKAAGYSFRQLKPSLPIFYDIEENSIYKHFNKDPNKLLKMIMTFCETVKKETGIDCGLYINKDWYQYKLEAARYAWYKGIWLWYARPYISTDASYFPTLIENDNLQQTPIIWQYEFPENGKAGPTKFDKNYLYRSFGIPNNYVPSDASSSSTNSGNISSNYIVGDINNDGKVDQTDLDLIGRYVTKTVTLTEEQKKKADINKDGRIDVDDLQLLSTYISEGLEGIVLQIGELGAAVWQDPRDITSGQVTFLKEGELVTLSSLKTYPTDNGVYIKIRTNGYLDYYIRLDTIAGYDEDDKDYFNDDGTPKSKELFYKLSKYVFDFKQPETDGSSSSTSTSTGDIVGDKCWPTNSKNVSQEFGHKGHGGMDIASGAGTPVYAAMSGTVTKTVKNIKSQEQGASGDRSYGNQIVITVNSTLKLRFAHLQYGSISVDVGDKISVGRQIAKIGNTGNTHGSGGGYHLHFEVIKNGTRVNPRNYFS